MPRSFRFVRFACERTERTRLRSLLERYSYVDPASVVWSGGYLCFEIDLARLPSHQDGLAAEGFLLNELARHR